MDYPYIRAWDRLMGSKGYWTTEIVARAKRENAPADAIYHTAGIAGAGEWVTASSITSETTRHLIEDFATQVRAGVR